MARAAWIVLVLFLGAFAATPAQAQTGCAVSQTVDNSLDEIVGLYKNCTKQWEGTLGRYALSLFWLLAAIEFCWNAICLALRNTDLNEWLAELVNQIFFLGFFLALLTNATAWTGAIVESFRTAGAEALKANGVPAGIAPSDIFDTGLNIAIKMLEALSWHAPAQSIFVALSALAIIFCFALIAAAIILALVESYVVLSGGVLLMGFGGSRWTKDFAVKTLIYAVSVGAKLFVLQLIAGLGAQIIGTWAKLPAAQSAVAPVNATTNIMVIVGSTLVLWVLVKSVPDMIQGLINGASPGASTGLAGAVASLTGSVYALGMVMNSARDLSREQTLEDQRKQPGQTGPGMGRRMLANIGSAAIGNIGNRISGRASIGGNRVGQVAGELGRQAGDLRSARNRREDEAGEQQKRKDADQANGGSPTSPPPTQPPGSGPGPSTGSGTTPRASPLASPTPGVPANNNDPNKP